jgi:hypothetical protein
LRINSIMQKAGRVHAATATPGLAGSLCAPVWHTELRQGEKVATGMIHFVTSRLSYDAMR